MLQASNSHRQKVSNPYMYAISTHTLTRTHIREPSSFIIAHTDISWNQNNVSYCMLCMLRQKKQIVGFSLISYVSYSDRSCYCLVLVVVENSLRKSVRRTTTGKDSDDAQSTFSSRSSLKWQTKQESDDEKKHILKFLIFVRNKTNDFFFWDQSLF